MFKIYTKINICYLRKFIHIYLLLFLFRRAARQKTKQGYALKRNIFGEKLLWFRDNLDPGVVYTPEMFENLIEKYVVLIFLYFKLMVASSPIGILLLFDYISGIIICLLGDKLNNTLINYDL